MRTAIVLQVILLTVCSAYADPTDYPTPLPGIYRTSDGSLLPARYSESWSDSSGHLIVGNTHHWMSWDGGSLGAQWYFVCSDVEVTLLLEDNMDEIGNGTQEWWVQYGKGKLVLDGNAPWANGEPVYVADTYRHDQVALVTFENWHPVSVLTTVQVSGVFKPGGYSFPCFACMSSSTMGQTPQKLIDTLP